MEAHISDHDLEEDGSEDPPASTKTWGTDGISLQEMDPQARLRMLNRMQDLIRQQESDTVVLRHYMQEPQEGVYSSCGTSGCLLGWSLSDLTIRETLGLRLAVDRVEDGKATYWPVFAKTNRQLGSPSSALAERSVARFLFSAANHLEKNAYLVDKRVALCRVEYVKYLLENEVDLEEMLSDGVGTFVRPEIAKLMTERVGDTCRSVIRIDANLNPQLNLGA